jgi:hypothetical protein
MTRMCLDPGQYEPDEYWLSIGVATVEQVRHERLWRALEAGDTPQHLAVCAECLALFESFTRLRAISVVPDAVGLDLEASDIAVSHCPDAATIAAYQGGEIEGEPDEAIRQHLKICALCREDVAFLARSLEPRDRLLSHRMRLVLMAVAAAALLVTVIPWKRGHETREVAKLDFTPSSRWAQLVRMPEVNRAELLRESPEEHHSRLEQVLAAYEKGQFAKAEDMAGIMTSVVEDPSAEYLLAMARYKQNKVTEGYKAMLASERMSPQTGARCWATLQYALLMGDKKSVEREAGHAGSEPEYAPRCRDILLKLG